MSELKLLVEDKKVVYNGLFRIDEIYGIIRKKLSSRGYFMIEKKSQEDILENGKQVYIELEPLKMISDYDKGKMKILFWIKGAKDKVITIDGHKQKYQQGEVNITFFAWHETDHKNKWEGSGAQFFFRVLMDKFIRHDQNHQIEDDIKRDCNQLADEIKSYLNMTRFKISHDMHPHKG
jgi:hypothetical protein